MDKLPGIEGTTKTWYIGNESTSKNNKNKTNKELSNTSQKDEIFCSPRSDRYA